VEGEGEGDVCHVGHGEKDLGWVHGPVRPTRLQGCRVADCRLQVADCRLQMADCRLHVAACGCSVCAAHYVALLVTGCA